MESKFNIPVLQADLPSGREISHWISKIDKRHIYSNFGPLLTLYERELVNRGFIKIDSTIGKNNTAHVCAVSSGTTAIQATIAALNLKPKSKILMPSYTFSGTALSAVAQNCEVIFCDVDSRSWVLTPEIAFEMLKFTRFDVVIPVALFGIEQDVEQWDLFTQETGIPVIIDAASALGQQQIGKLTHVVYSLHATKPLGVGEGGLVASANELLIRRVREFINFGLRNGTVHSYGINGKLSEYAAAIGLAQLDRWEMLHKRRMRLYRAYFKELTSYVNLIHFPPISAENANMFMPIRFYEARLSNEVQQVLQQQGIETRRWYAPGLHEHPYFSATKRFSRNGDQKLTVTEALCSQVLCLPFHTFMTREQFASIINQLQLAFGKWQAEKYKQDVSIV